MFSWREPSNSCVSVVAHFVHGLQGHDQTRQSKDSYLSQIETSDQLVELVLSSRLSVVVCFKLVGTSPVKRSNRPVQTEDVKLQLQQRDRVLNFVKEAGLRQHYAQTDLELLCVGTFS